jgi:hypothetical protein
LRIILTRNKLVILFLFSWSKISINLSLGLHKGRPSYCRRSLQPSKENIQHFKAWKFSFFLFLWVIFALLIRIRNLNADLDPDPATQINADPCGSGSATLLPTHTALCTEQNRNQ